MPGVLHGRDEMSNYVARSFHNLRWTLAQNNPRDYGRTPYAKHSYAVIRVTLTPDSERTSVTLLHEVYERLGRLTRRKYYDTLRDPVSENQALSPAFARGCE